MTLKAKQNPEELWISHLCNYPVHSNAYNHIAPMTHIPYGATAKLDQTEIKYEPIGKEAIQHE
jgi:hypothetical protein